MQNEPAESLDPEFGGLLASIGTVKGKPFAPDARMKKIFEDAAAVGNATARAITVQPRRTDCFYYPNSHWFNLLPGGSYDFLKNGHHDLDARTLFFHNTIFVTPAMSMKMVGVGSQYAGDVYDSEGRPSTAEKPIDCACRPTSQRRISGRSLSTTCRRPHCSRPLNPCRA